ncbi:membrane-associated phosphatidylinositol transfer protein 2 isoform X3 [Phocoena sinus]|uniref:membrane-associated phosphatidylinositol transfer protein 2 isoform X3 n=1 Tax=Phocoena sinus TaxID=42100 RepID=UPI0013C4C966|nr:membrane-associated phosphatidylinositol transfer protein 2 isoform X3 [Phocoena sinus]
MVLKGPRGRGPGPAPGASRAEASPRLSGVAGATARPAPERGHQVCRVAPGGGRPSGRAEAAGGSPRGLTEAQACRRVRECEAGPARTGSSGRWGARGTAAPRRRAVRPVRRRARPRAPPAAASSSARGPRSERPDPRRPARAPARRTPADGRGACPRGPGCSPGASWRRRRRRRRAEPRGAAGRAGAAGPGPPGRREAAAAQRCRRGRSRAARSGKKSRNETFGEGSGVEILENRPYTDGPGGSGQYTHKVYHVGMHIPSWFRSILPKAALRVVEESWNAYPYTRTRFTCPFVEKFSIDIETFYKTDAGENPNVFSLSPVEKNQLTIDFIDIVKDPVPPNEYKTEEDPKLFHSTKTQRGPLSENWIEEYKQQVFPIMCAYKLCKVEFRYWGMQSKIERFIHDTGLRKVMVRAHRQAWCWQDEWYGLNMENIRELEKEAQLMLSRKMAQFSEDDEGAAELAKDEAPQAQAPREPPQPSSSGGEPLAGRGLKKQWSTSSKSSRSSKRGASPSRHSISEWRMQSIARDSDESSDDEFFDAHEDLSDSEEMFPKDITKWNSNDLMDKIESPEPEDTQDGLYRQSAPEFRVASSVEQLNIIEDEVSPPLAVPPSKIHALLLLLHGGTILDTGAGDPGSKQGDTNTIATVFDTVMRVHYPSALGHLAIRLVPCPPICSAAFALVSDLSPYSHDEGCLSSSQDHIPLAALPLLATSSPHYQEAVATVIQRANLAYGDFIKSQEGVTFNGQVCLIGDCVGGILAFDALCSSNQTVSESQSSSRRGSVASAQDTDLLSPGTTVNAAHGGTLESSRHLSRSNIDIPRSNGAEDPRQQLPRKRSDSSTYELDTIQQHQAFLSSLHASVLRNEPSSRHSSSSTMLDGTGAVGKFDFEIADLFLFGCPLGLVLALRKTVIPSLDVFQLRPACQQVYNLFHPADPSASRLEPLLERRFHALPPLSIPRYQRYPLGDGCSTLLADALQAHNAVFQEHAAPSSPGTAPTARGFRRASEISIASQVSGMAESYTASNIAQKDSLQRLEATGVGATGIWWVETSCAAQHRTVPRTALWRRVIQPPCP